MQEQSPPRPEEVREARKRAGLTQAEAAGMVYSTDRSWQYWESGNHSMPPALWELFLIKVAQRVDGRS